MRWLKFVSTLASLFRLWGNFASNVASMADSDDESVDLEVEVLSLGCEGLCSFTRTQRMCRAIQKFCGEVPDHVTEIAALARTQPSHIERDLHRWCKRQPWAKVLPEPYDFLIPCSLDGGLTKTERSHSVLAPHEVFANMWVEAPEIFEEMFGTPEEVTDFWRKSNPDWVARHPAG